MSSKVGPVVEGTARAWDQDRIGIEKHLRDIKRIGPPPLGLDIPTKKQYKHLLDTALPGTLTKADTETVIMTAKLLVEFYEDMHGMSSAKSGQLISCLSKLGRTPLDRMRMATAQAIKKKAERTGEEQSENPFDDF